MLGTAWGAADDLIWDAEYHRLRPPGPGGGAAVVRERSFLVIGDGEAYAVGRTGLALGESGSWTVDDGYRPVGAGTYGLDRGRDGGLLWISGTSTRRRDAAGWQTVGVVLKAGLTFHSCGCGGPGFRPRTPAEVRARRIAAMRLGVPLREALQRTEVD
ncbi:hypothetical protein [Streptomyces sp. NPDC058086]|uniref:hypothetical protein n=1 Tax=Streptomyces sp. NPDC058086 TaxID=3346334 RepID=UPI0036E741ED